MSMLLDYETLRLIWWVLLGVLLIGFAIMDGFDLGVGMLLPWVAKTDNERRVTINTVGPTWEGNQVWLILGGGAIFAAWPTLYAVSFSGFYLAMLVVLLALILRPVGFKYRSKLPHYYWRQMWDIMLFIGGFVPALIFGVAIGNILQGVPFYFDDELRSFYTGYFLELLNPFGLLCGVTSLAMLAMHGGAFLVVKTTGIIRYRAIIATRLAAVALIVLFAFAGILIATKISGYHIVSAIAPEGPSNPLAKTVVVEIGGWLNNYKLYPWTLSAPILGFLGALLAIVLIGRQSKLAFISSALSVFGVIATVGLSMFPIIFPSVSHPNHSLTVWDASSSEMTLFVMLLATLFFLPIVLLYTAWVYRVLRGKVTDESVKSNQDAY